MSRFFLSALILLTTAAFAAVYQWRDSNGELHYSDRPKPGAQQLQLAPESNYYGVDYVYDGDTVRLKDGRKVRLLSINTPEIDHDRKPGEPGGEVARKRLENLLNGHRVRLEYDVERHDKYGRTLAHLFTDTRRHLNRILVEEGLAAVSIHPPNLKYLDSLLEAQRQAEQAQRGIWGMGYYRPKPIEILRAKHLYGWQRLVGTPLTLKQGRKFVRLMFAADLVVTIPKSSLEWFPDLHGYLGHSVEVRGWPSRRGRIHSILVRHPSALIILD